MKKILLIAVTILLCSYSSLIAQNSSSAQLARELMVKSGAMDEIQEMEKMWASDVQMGIGTAIAQAHNQGKSLEKEKLDQLHGVLTKVWDTNLVQAIVLQHYEKDLSPKDMENVLRWLDSPLGQKITQMEKAFGEAGTAVKDPMAEAALLNMVDPATRRALTGQFLEVSGLVDQVLALVMNRDLAMSLAMEASLNPDNLSMEAIRNKVEDRGLQLRGMLLHQLYNNNVVTYKDLTNQEYAQYIAFYQSTSGKKYLKTSFRALNQAFIEIATKAGNEIGKLLQQTVAGREAKYLPFQSA